MVGMVAASWRERAASLLDSVKFGGDIPSKMKPLRKLKEVILHRDPSLLAEFVPRLIELQYDRASPVRKFLAEMIGEVGSKHIEFLPEMTSCLIFFLKDETPAVARQAISTGTFLFRYVLEKVVIQGLYSSAIEDSIKSSWAWMLKFKSTVLPIAVQPGSDGVRLLAVRFIEALVLLYTPDPNVSADPPPEGSCGLDVNISWIRGGHPLLNVGDLASEAIQSLGLLLDQLRLPQVKSLSSSLIIVLINSLSTIAKNRPSFYGRILPVLLSLDPATSIVKGVQVPGAHHALKNAFMACLNCTHSSAEPWRARLFEALKAINAGELTNQELNINKSSGVNSVSPEESLSSKDDTMSKKACDEVNNERKRSMMEDNSDVQLDDSVSSKRLRQTAVAAQDIDKDSLETSSKSVQNSFPEVGSAASRDKSSEPVQQLVGMFGALVAQGEKAAQSLEILISSISSELLAEVVIANIHNLPLTCPISDEEGDLFPKMGDSSASDRNSSLLLQSPQLVPDVQSLSSLTPILLSLLNVQPSVSHDIPEIHQRNEVEMLEPTEPAFVSSSIGDENARISASLPSSITTVALLMENGSSVHADVEAEENKIPGLGSTSSFDETQESQDASHVSSTELRESSQEHALNMGSTRPFNILPAGCMSGELSEVQSTGVAVPDTTQVSSALSVTVAPQYLLPKMTLLDVNLTDEDKDRLQKVAFLRIIEAYKQIAPSGGSDARFSLLAHLGIEFPLELDSWGLLQKHVLSDYLNLEGHELTLRILYRLYRETEQDQDFLSSRTALSVYESFLLAVAETLRDTFPASDKSLGRLLAEVPYLSEGVLKLLECLCSPEGSEKHEKDFRSGDRVTQGLSAVWNLILLRPSNRERCLLIALESAVHTAEEVRMKAIRLVANKLFPMPSISPKIEDFANEKLYSVIDAIPVKEHTGADDSTSGLQKDADLEQPCSGVQKLSGLAKNEMTSNAQVDQSIIPSLISEAQRCMSLYFALCTKKHSLLRQIFAIYERMGKPAKEAVHRHIPILIRTIGPSPELLGIFSDPPAGSERLVMQVLQILTDGAIPPPAVISCIWKFYHSKLKDVEILIPIISFLSKDEILPIFPRLVNLPLGKFQAALPRLLQGSSQSGPGLAPAEILIAIHGIDPEKDRVPLKKIMDACSACFEQRKVFTHQVLAKVLNQLVEQIPLPLLFMRTVIQAIGVFPALVDFVMEILSRLVSKQIWKYPKLWVGFLKCAIQTMPQSFPVLLQLPAAQLENALSKNPVLKPPLVEHASQIGIKSTLPGSTLVVLGLAQDSQPFTSQQPNQNQAADTSSSVADVTTEATQESSAVS